MWGLAFLAAAGVGAILLAYAMGRSYERFQRDLTEFSNHPVYRVDVRWEPCAQCADAWSTPTGCGFAGCVDGSRPRVVSDDAS